MLPSMLPARVLPPLQLGSQQPVPMLPSVPTNPMLLAPVPTSEIGSMSGPAASRSDNSLDPFNVTWRGDTFDISLGPNKGLTAVQAREARVIIASFADWDEASNMGQQLPRAAGTLAQLLRRDDGSKWGLRQWREWTKDEDMIVWQHFVAAPTRDMGRLAAQLQRDYLPERMLGELVGRLKLFARRGENPAQARPTIGGFPRFGLKDQAKQNR